MCGLSQKKNNLNFKHSENHWAAAGTEFSKLSKKNSFETRKVLLHRTLKCLFKPRDEGESSPATIIILISWQIKFVLLPTRVQPKSPDWRGWLYHWTPRSLYSHTWAQRRWEQASTPPPSTTGLRPSLTSCWPAEVSPTWAWRKRAPAGLGGLRGLGGKGKPGVKSNCRTDHSDQGILSGVQTSSIYTEFNPT